MFQDICKKNSTKSIESIQIELTKINKTISVFLKMNYIKEKQKNDEIDINRQNRQEIDKIDKIDKKSTKST